MAAMTIFLKKFWPVLALIATVLGGCGFGGVPAEPSEDSEISHAGIPVIAPTSCRDLSSFLADNGYDWDNLDQGVPLFILEALPPDLHRIPEVREKKRLFYLSLLPMVLLINEDISRQRQEVIVALRHYDNGFPLSPIQHRRLLDLTVEYRVKGNPLVDLLARRALLSKLDTLPVSMVLAQAANESAYGTSRFALEGNNLFGQWTFTPGNGMVPLKRSAGETYEVQRFATLYDSVRAYMKNLNVHRAYGSLRELRSLLRERDLELRGTDLAAGLLLYSARREAYVKEIRSIIRGNSLSRLSSLSLQKPFPTVIQQPTKQDNQKTLLAAR
jgi:Bax protein